jgi:selenocysteine-specific elongation factor
VRVRNVQVFGRNVNEAVLGERVALALHGVSREDIRRGDWLLTPDAASPSSMLDARFELLRDAPRSLKTRTRVRLHLGASEVIGRVHLLEREELKPGESALVQMRLETPAVALRGDRFVVRSYSPQVTIGGGSVLVAHAAKHRRKDDGVVETLSLVERGSPRERVEQKVRDSGEKGIEVGQIPREAGVSASEFEEAVSALLGEGIVFRIGNTLLHSERLKNVADDIARSLADYQAAHRLRWGMTKGELRNRFAGLPQEVFAAAVDSLTGTGRLLAKEERYRIDSPGVQYSLEEARLRERIEAEILKAGVNVPYVKELASGESREKVNDIVQMLVEEGKLVKITAELFFHTDSIRAVETLLRGLLSKKGQVQVSEFKDVAKTSRKYAVPLLEYFDKKGVTRRQGDMRVPGGKC